MHNCCVTKNLTHLRVRAVFASLLLRKNPAPKSSTYFRAIPYVPPEAWYEREIQIKIGDGMANNANVCVNFGNTNTSLIVKSVISFGTPITDFRFSLNTAFSIDNIKADTGSEWVTIREWKPQWQYKSREIGVSAETPMRELTIEYSFHERLSGWCNVIEEKRIALSSYSAWTIFETSVPINFIFKMQNMENYFVINARYEDANKLWIYGETDHDKGNLIALKKGHYHVASTRGFHFYYMNEDEKDYASCYTSNYDGIMEYFTCVFGNKDISKMSIVSLGLETGGGAYFRKELMVIDKINVSEDKEKIRQSVIGLLGHELGHNWFSSSDTSTWEDWVGETGAEWAVLLYILSLNENEFFKNRISRAKEKYIDTPVIKSPDGNRPVDGVHIRGVMMFYEIYLRYGIDTISTMLKILSELPNPTTENFLHDLRNKIGSDIPDKIERGLTMKDYANLII